MDTHRYDYVPGDRYIRLSYTTGALIDNNPNQLPSANKKDGSLPHTGVVVAIAKTADTAQTYIQWNQDG